MCVGGTIGTYPWDRKNFRGNSVSADWATFVVVICEISEFRVFALDEILIPPVSRTRPTNFPYK